MARITDPSKPLAGVGNLPRLAERYGDLGLAFFVVGVVAMMILPLPTWLLDLLLTLNIAVSVTLLMMAVYVPDALRFSSFPTLLLVTTLFRLGLNVSSTRLILAQADAGEVIRAFGNFVTQGNLVVGAVVFLILTLIQFIVIAKGAERVAEVAARFTLDAMPGKQMSIDADLRAGAFDLEEARRRRAILQRESQLYGAMDGAMKFVKGDAIAGLVIIAVNIMGGLAVGILQVGMPAGEALDVYTVLTIGDGLVSQIPALIVSVAAGMIVTRVASEEEGAHLAKDIGGQILRQPKALAITSGLLLGLSIVPGMPFVPFLLLGGAGALAAFGLLRARAAAEREALRAKTAQRDAETDDTGIGAPASLLEVRAPSAWLDSLGETFLRDDLPRIRARLFDDLGVPVPAPRVVRVDRGEGDEQALELWVSRVPALRLAVAPEANDDRARVCDAIEASLRRNAHELLGIQEVQRLLDQTERRYPALVREVVPKLLNLQLLTDVLRRLVEEQVSIRDLRTILGALADWARAEKDPLLLTEHVRASLKRWMTHTLAQGERALDLFLLDPLIEDAIRAAIQRVPTGSYLALDPEMSQDIVSAVRSAVEANRPALRGLPVILTTLEIRRFVKRLCETEIPDLQVVSYQELEPELELRPLVRIAIGG
jgi:type III secretion protein V